MRDFFQYLDYAIRNNLIAENRYLMLLEGLGITVLLTLVSFVFGTLLGVGLTYLRTRRVKWAVKLLNFFNNIIVTIPPLVLLMIFVYMVFRTSSVSLLFIASLAFSIRAGAVLSDIFVSALKAIDPFEIEASRSLGLTALQTFRHIILPQAVDISLPLYSAQFVVAAQTTSIVGFVALMDLSRASVIITGYTMDPYLTIFVSAVAYFLIGLAGNALVKLIFKRKRIHLDEQTQGGEV